MSTNGVNACEDAEMADCDGEKVVTMMDVLKEQEDFEEDANAVLGASDDKNCTYSKGYIKRQAIYACMTCCSDAKNDPTKWAGVCLACSLNCHENHELIELYTKRNFRCDCGNPKFNSHSCQFTPYKTDLNVENVYNQNFSGVYCVCHRPYPDPDSIVEEEMIQCIICEDWLHSNHLDAVVPASDLYTEMVCKACMEKNQFLHDYSEYAVNKENVEIDILNTSSELNGTCNGKTDIDSMVNKHVESSTNSDNSNIKDIGEDENDTHETDTNTSADKPKTVDKQDHEKILDGESPKQEDQITTTHLESVDESTDLLDSIVNNDLTKLDSLETQDVASESQNETKPEVDQENEEQTKEPPIENDHKLEENNSSFEKEEQTQTQKEKEDTSDNHTKEQVEENMLLEDPVETGQPKVVSETVSSDTNPSNSDAVAEEKPEAMDISEINVTGDQEEKAESNVQSNSQSDSEAIPEQSKSSSTAEQSESTLTSDQSENALSADQSEKKPCTEPAEPVATDEERESAATADSASTTENTNTAPITEHDENVSNTEESESESKTEQSENQLEEKDENDKISIDKDKITSTDVDMDENDSNVNDTKNNPSLDNEPDKPATDILKRKLSVDCEDIVKKPKTDDKKCVRPRGQKKVYCGATFWPSNFRHKLCTCNECISMYKDLSVLFLIDPEDTVTAYETLGKEKTDGKPVSQYEKGMAALSSLGRVQQINALTEYTKLRDKLLDFLKSFKDRKVVVKEEDIKAFFAGMKPVREPDGVYFCR